MTIGEKIKKYRLLRGMTQQELGEACGFSEGSAGVRIRQYESNQKRPTVSTLETIARTLGVDYFVLAWSDLDFNCMLQLIDNLYEKIAKLEKQTQEGNYDSKNNA